MNAPAKIALPDEGLVDCFYKQHDKIRKLNRLIDECVIVLGMEAERRAREGRDELDLRRFVARIKRELAA